MTFHLYKDAKGEWRWRLKARNGRVVAVSGEGYKRKATMLKTMDRMWLSLNADNYVKVED